VIGAAGVLFLFFENWFDQVGKTTMNVIRSVLLVAAAFFLYRYVAKKGS